MNERRKILIINTIIVITLVFFLIESLMVESRLDNLNVKETYDFTLNDNVRVEVNSNYNELLEESLQEVNIISKDGKIKLGTCSMTSKELYTKEALFEKVLDRENYEVYYFKEKKSTNKKEKQMDSNIKPIVIYEDGSIEVMPIQDKANEILSKVKSVDDNLKEVKIEILKNEIENYHNYDFFLNAYKILNSLEEERVYVNKIIDEYIKGNKIPKNLEETKDSEEHYKFQETLKDIELIRGYKLDYNHNGAEFKNLSPKEVKNMYNRGYFVENDYTYDFKDIEITFSKDEYYIKKAKIRRPIFYINGMQIIGKRFNNIQDSIISFIKREKDYIQYKDGSKEIFLYGGWSIKVDNDGKITEVLYRYE